MSGPLPLKVLVIYDKRSTFTNTVFDHLNAFARYSRHQHLFLDGGDDYAIAGVPDAFDAVVIHYSIRVAFGRLPPMLYAALARFRGAKILFVQDEYDMTERTRGAIEDLGIDTVFTVVPDEYRDLIYPNARFPGVRFITTLTGFAPLHAMPGESLPPLASRPIDVGYRGRALAYWYGDLGQEKQFIGQAMRGECEKRGVSCDIEWDEGQRVYGDKWTKFLLSCKVTLGTESGCNRFDADGSLRTAVAAVLERNPVASYPEVRRALWGDEQEIPIMNQVSPRVFEAIALKTGLVLFEGKYSGVLRPDVHFIALKKDLSNMDAVFGRLSDLSGLQSMVDRAYADIIGSGRYTYQAFVATYDVAVTQAMAGKACGNGALARHRQITAAPVCHRPSRSMRLLSTGWQAVPESVRCRLRPLARGMRRLLDP